MDSEPLQWKRTGLICLRAEPYLIIKWHGTYEALVGLHGDRVSLGYFPDAEAAKTACAEHRQKEAEAP